MSTALLLPILILGLVATTASAADESAGPSFHTGLRAALSAASEDQSIVLAIFSADKSGACRFLWQKTIGSDEFRDQAGAVRVADVDVDVDAATARSFGVRGVPHLVLLSADGKIIARHDGLIEPDALVRWIDTGRQRIAAGQWEGTAPGAELDAFTAKAAARRLNPEDLKNLILMLERPDPADRAAAGRLILEQREQAVMPLIEAVNAEYLGLRIAAAELLGRLLDGMPEVDPWLSPGELRQPVETLKQWWNESGKLVEVTAVPDFDAPMESAIRLALDAFRRDDPVRRTEAMSALVRYGPAVLPALRTAIRQHDSTGDHRTVALLEDVRWAILVPDTLDRRAGRVRNPLARGTSPERQTAAARLGRGGRDAIPALTELVNDPDSLVAESAVRALSEIGGRDAIPAMAGLLKAADSNLRITAAQALGRSRNPEATSFLLSAIGDPNEIVASTALAAIEEVHSDGGRASLPPELAGALKAPLTDARWRVRATAAEIIGKLRIRELTGDLNELLEDSDGFVVKNVLVALRQVGAAPNAEELVALSRRLPSLRGDAVKMLLDTASESTVEIILGLYDTSGVDERMAILNALTEHRFDRRRAADMWRPLIERAAVETEPRLRRTAATLLGDRQSADTAPLLTVLLADEDLETRVAAAEGLILRLSGRGRRSSYDVIAGWSSFSPMGDGDDAPAADDSDLAAQTAEWRAALLQRPQTGSEPVPAVAVYVTGDGKSDLPLLLSALDKLDPATARQLTEMRAIEMVLSKLPWPEGADVLERFCAMPVLFSHAAAASGQGAPEIAEYLLEPDRFRSSVERASGSELQLALSILVGGSNWSLLLGTEQARQIAATLTGSTNGAWRAAGVYALGRDRGADPDVLAHALKDDEAWVRVAAVQGVAGAARERPFLESKIVPLLDDDSSHVRRVTAAALLEPEIREAAGLDRGLQQFRFGELRAGRTESRSTGDRPLRIVPEQPEYLEKARSVLERSTGDETTVFALLLAQFGDSSGVDRLVESYSGSRAERLSEPAVAAIALSGDAKYLPFLRSLTETMNDEWELRGILRALRGMTGPEARQLRLEVNRRMRGVHN